MKNNRYLILSIIYLAGVAAPLNQFKVPPMLSQLMTELGISLAASGWLMSVFAFIGFVFALPSGLIVREIGVKASGIAALITLLAGSLMGGLSATAYMILISRVIEGAGLCLLAVTGPAAIAAWFTEERRGFAMGVWGTWVPMGSIIMFSVAPLLGGWKQVWLFTSLYTFLILIVFVIFFRMPSPTAVEGQKAVTPRNSNAWLNRSIWFLGAAFLLYNTVIIVVKTYAPTFLVMERGVEPLMASAITSLVMVFALIAGPLSGILSDFLKSRKILFIVGTLMGAVVMSLAFSSGVALFTFLMIILGITGGLVPTAVFSSVPEIMVEPAHTGIGMSIIALGQNAGMCLGPIMFSYTADHFSWQIAGLVMVPMMLGACLLGMFVRVR